MIHIYQNQQLKQILFTVIAGTRLFQFVIAPGYFEKKYLGIVNALYTPTGVFLPKPNPKLAAIIQREIRTTTLKIRDNRTH